MKNNNKSYIPFIISILVFYACCILVLISANFLLHVEANQHAHQLVGRLNDMIDDTYITLREINNKSGSECDEETLRLMRQHLYLSPYIVGIGFYKDENLICTSGAGKLEKPIKSSSPSYVGQYGSEVKIVKSLPLLMFDDYSIDAIVVKLGDFSVVVDPSRFDILNSDYSIWEAVHIDSLKNIHLAGKTGVYEMNNNQEGFFLGYSTQCSDLFNRDNCIAVRIDILKYLTARAYDFSLFFFMALIITIGSYYWSNIMVINQKSIKKRVGRGLKKKSFYWLYQPIIDMKSGAVIGCEALARFKDDYGVLSPNEFIPVLKELNKTWLFTNLMIDNVINELESKILPVDFKISLNIFPHDIEFGYINEIKNSDKLNKSKFTICIEVIEDEYLDSTSAHECLASLAQSGFSLSVDDFGTGYSNLRTIMNIDFDYLKIDRSFVQDVETSGLKKSIIPVIVEIAKKYNMEIIAEGIETKLQHDILRELGINFGQGWQYSKPINAEDLQAFVNKVSLTSCEY